MKSKKDHINTFKGGVAPWLRQAADTYRVVLFSDTRTYRHLLAIYWGAVGLAFPEDGSKAKHNEQAMTFLSWFLAKGNNCSAYVGLMWLHHELGEKLTECARRETAKVANDPRLGYLLTAFILLCDQDGDDPRVRMYYEMAGKGWDSCTDDRFKDSLFHGLAATLTQESLRELVVIGKSLGHSSSDTMTSLARARVQFSRAH